MTPSTKRPVVTRTLPALPIGVAVTSDRLAWSTVQPPESAAQTWPGTEGVLDVFIELALGGPPEMAAFMTTYGVPELCEQHGRPDQHAGRTAAYCPFGHDGEESF